jgi:hypothetical protein
MFHATSRDRVDSILQNGLLQSKNNQDYDTLVWESSPGIYFFESYDNALKIGRMKFGYDAVVLAVDVTDIPIQLDPDFIPLTPENDPFAQVNVTPNFDKRKMLKDKLRNQWVDKTGIPRAWRTFADVSPDRISIAPENARISAWTDVRMHTEFHEDLDVYTTQAWIDDVLAGEITVDAEGFVINAWVLPEFVDEHLGKAMMMRFEEDIGFYPTPREWASLLSKASAFRSVHSQVRNLACLRSRNDESR